jgi:hypothetical protein
LDCGRQLRIALLVVPPGTPEDVALTATFMACARGNSISAAETLVRAREQVGVRCA